MLRAAAPALNKAGRAAAPAAPPEAIVIATASDAMRETLTPTSSDYPRAGAPAQRRTVWASTRPSRHASSAAAATARS